MNKIDKLYSKMVITKAFELAYLEWPEIKLLHDVRGKNCDMLDLGVGSGRTSLFYIPVVSNYVGVDIAHGMIDRCRDRFADLHDSGNSSFHVEDATSLKKFEDNSFDLVLFSYNGLDCIPGSERDSCFSAVKRVLRPGGVFVFSSHNIRFISHYYRFKKYKGPRYLYKEIKRLFLNYKINGQLNELVGCDQVEFWDGFYPGDQEFKHLHVKPEYQIKELERHGFNDVRALSKVDGRVLNDSEIAMTTEPWVYYYSKK